MCFGLAQVCSLAECWYTASDHVMQIHGLDITQTNYTELAHHESTVLVRRLYHHTSHKQCLGKVRRLGPPVEIRHIVQDLCSSLEGQIKSLRVTVAGIVAAKDWVF